MHLGMGMGMGMPRGQDKSRGHLHGGRVRARGASVRMEGL